MPACSSSACRRTCTRRRFMISTDHRLACCSVRISDGPWDAFFLFFVVPSRRLFTRSMSERRTKREESPQMIMATIQIAMTTTKNMAGLDLHQLVEQVRTQPDTGRQQLLVEFRTDSGGRESS